MKTKRLIELLQKADPTGELPVSVGPNPVVGAWAESCYWDGYPWVEVRDERGCIGSMKLLNTGDKVILTDYSIEDYVLETYPDEELDIIIPEECEKQFNRYWKDKIIKWKEIVDRNNKENP